MAGNEQLVLGWHPILEAIKSEKELEKVLISSKLDQEKSRKMVQQLRAANIPFQYVPPEKIRKMAGPGAVHQGVVARISPVKLENAEALIETLGQQETTAILVLDGITDVRNFGAICRSAVCFGIDAVIFPAKGMASINELAIKSSAGALLQLRLGRSENMKLTFQYLKANGFHIVAMTEKGSEEKLRRFTAPKTAMVLGAEGSGISPYLLKLTDDMIRIPIGPEIESLNVSVAAGIALYEWKRQRDLP